MLNRENILREETDKNKRTFAKKIQNTRNRFYMGSAHERFLHAVFAGFPKLREKSKGRLTKKEGTGCF